MPRIKFTSALKRFFPSLTEESVSASTVSEAITELNRKYPGIRSYLVEENGQLRKHVNIFIAGELIRDRDTLMDSIGSNDELIIFQALSGG